MKVSRVNTQECSNSKSNNAAEIIRKIYPEINNSYFSEKPNVFDKNYVTGSTRASAMLKANGYIDKKAAADIEIKKYYSEHQNHFRYISPHEANTNEGSWKTVVSGKRPMGQFSVDSLYSPELHAIAELENIGLKLFPKENNAFLYIVVVFRKDSEKGEEYANKFIELYDRKREIMSVLEGENQIAKVIKSEMAIAEEMGSILSYTPEDIREYMLKLSSSAS